MRVRTWESRWLPGKNLPAYYRPIQLLHVAIMHVFTSSYNTLFRAVPRAMRWNMIPARFFRDET